MLYTFVLGTPVYAEDRHLGKLERIIVDNGIANQITVAPGLLGIERVVPINDIVETSTDSVQLRITDEDWRAYSAFQIQQAFGGSQEVVPGQGLVPGHPAITANATNTSQTTALGTTYTERTVSQMSVVLSSKTKVVDDNAPDTEYHLKGMVVDTGRPQQLLLENDTIVPFESITMLDEQRIHLRGIHARPVLDADRGYEQIAAIDPLGDERR